MNNAILEFLEKLATTAHHNINIEDLLKNQPEQVREAFTLNDGYVLKSLYAKPTELADKTTVFQV